MNHFKGVSPAIRTQVCRQEFESIPRMLVVLKKRRGERNVAINPGG